MPPREHMFSLLNMQTRLGNWQSNCGILCHFFPALVPVVFEEAGSSTHVIDPTAVTKGEKTVNGLRIAYF
jgi:hypothetical protein